MRVDVRGHVKPQWLAFGIAVALGLAGEAPSVAIGQTALPYRPFTFKGYECTANCEGHEAGYEWAEEKGIDDPDDCGGNSESFIEGCRAYAEEQNGFPASNGSFSGGRYGSDDDDDDDDNDNDNDNDD